MFLLFIKSQNNLIQFAPKELKITIVYFFTINRKSNIEKLFFFKYTDRIKVTVKNWAAFLNLGHMYPRGYVRQYEKPRKKGAMAQKMKSDAFEMICYYCKKLIDQFILFYTYNIYSILSAYFRLYHPLKIIIMIDTNIILILVTSIVRNKLSTKLATLFKPTSKCFVHTFVLYILALNVGIHKR